MRIAKYEENHKDCKASDKNWCCPQIQCKSVVIDVNHRKNQVDLKILFNMKLVPG